MWGSSYIVGSGGCLKFSNIDKTQNQKGTYGTVSSSELHEMYQNQTGMIGADAELHEKCESFIQYFVIQFERDIVDGQDRMS